MLTREIARILDANLNRAREALRVMEDYVRFVLDDPAGCALLKQLRHDLRECVRHVPSKDLLGARNTPADVGTSISTASERQRTDARDAFVASAKRLSEALRTIEEYAKTFDAGLSAAIESLRYRVYELEQRVILRGTRSARFAKVRLYVLVTASMCRRDWLETAAEAIEGGADCIQLREKDLHDGELLSRARQLAALCRERGVMFIVNDRPDVALLSDADGVHLGQTDMPAPDARRILGPDRLIGLSTHTPEQFRAALRLTPDYIAVGPMFASTTKPQQQVPGPSLLALAESEASVPVVPVGGISIDNASILRQAGAKRLCVCSAIIGSADPRTAARALLE
ncbi:MAG: thiamine phosphate synthase [Phycisphaerae bacterium]